MKKIIVLLLLIALFSGVLKAQEAAKIKPKEPVAPPLKFYRVDSLTQQEVQGLYSIISTCKSAVPYSHLTAEQKVSTLQALDYYTDILNNKTRAIVTDTVKKVVPDKKLTKSH